MSSGRSRQDEIRAPQQRRSRERVEQILDATKKIIAEKGSARLKIIDIADVAGITVGSIYQYFPNKNAIVHALGEKYLDEFHSLVEERLSTQPRTSGEMADIIDGLVEDIYRMSLADPAIRDIWMGVAADKSLLEMSRIDGERNVAALVDAARALVADAELERLPVSMLLMFQFADTAIRVALDRPEAEGRTVVERAKAMLRVIWFTMT